MTTTLVIFMFKPGDQAFVAPYSTDNGNIINISLFVIQLLFLLIRDNLVLLQVGLKSLSYEMQKQEPAYDSNSLFGKKSDFVPEYGTNRAFLQHRPLVTICFLYILYFN